MNEAQQEKTAEKKNRTDSGGRNGSDPQPGVREQGGKGGGLPLELPRVQGAPPFFALPGKFEAVVVMFATAVAEASELAWPPIGGVGRPFVSSREPDATTKFCLPLSTMHPINKLYFF